MNIQKKRCFLQQGRLKEPYQTKNSLRKKRYITIITIRTSQKCTESRDFLCAVVHTVQDYDYHAPPLLKYKCKKVWKYNYFYFLCLSAVFNTSAVAFGVSKASE